ncbi:hypothetical protein [Bythopirellula polymerisocia]|uniref:Uncharacterized protein n=1 Tax=Bythopirellula polymerisocia TaxID=2528003 RepID=A0A5C6CZT3_9BACT|nr:hypothetical protein [Bythopirellula polymerisocia]TWU29958.1 hypothetical protein Pla144_07390 [Bythopirellula polymerisocia]
MSFFFASTPIAVFMFLVGCALLVAVLLKRSYRYFGKSKRSTVITGLEHLPRPKSTWDGTYRDAGAAVDRQEVEMAEMARDLSGQLTTKMIVLEQLISDSQKQIDRMEELLKEMESAGEKQRT